MLKSVYLSVREHMREPDCMMKAHWWSCVLGLLCMPAEVILDIGKAFQNPSTISFMRVNSSAEIMCTTSLANPMGLYMHRRFHKEQDVVYLDLNEFSVTKDTISNKFKGRINVSPAKQITQELRGFTFQLSLLELEDTNLYYCEWIYTDNKLNKLLMTSNGTVIIVREGGPEEQCTNSILDLTLICSIVIGFTVILFLIIGVLIIRCKRYKKKFRPAVPELPPRSERPRQTCSCHHHSAYLVTSLSTDVNTDFRGLL
ncbi:uncharacterized protein LOC116330886 [Oreochromis aureus]|uniref:uncharacterized protein LOC116330886 n=1 Tax=Oreochromis aureus TaxID=47969 RepID=UPI0012BD1AEB|nr:uncharacterized protein LOC116330886 [Oreochromis aureus]